MFKTIGNLGQVDYFKKTVKEFVTHIFIYAGTCKCKSGYGRGPDGECIVMSLRDTAQNTFPDGFTEKIITLVNSTSMMSKKHLVVSAESKQVMLPDSEVSLTASVSPMPREGSEKYQYEWTSLQQPDGSSAVKHQNGETLQLSKLSEGLYTFKVRVAVSTVKYQSRCMSTCVRLPFPGRTCTVRRSLT